MVRVRSLGSRTCKDYKPLDVYCQTKLEGELAVANTLEKYFIVRIAWVFGLNGKNFIKTMINVSKTYDEVRVVNDQIGTPTYFFDLVRLLLDMCENDKYGYYHATNKGGLLRVPQAVRLEHKGHHGDNRRIRFEQSCSSI